MQKVLEQRGWGRKRSGGGTLKTEGTQKGSRQKRFKKRGGTALDEAKSPTRAKTYHQKCTYKLYGTPTQGENWSSTFEKVSIHVRLLKSTNETGRA